MANKKSPETLKRRHGKLANAVEKTQSDRDHCPIELKNMKKKKLMAKDLLDQALRQAQALVE